MKPAACALAFLLCVCLSPASAQPLNAGAYESMVFEALAGNDFTRAAELGRALPASPAYSVAAEGVALAAWAQLDLEPATATWLAAIELPSRHDALPGLLYFLQRACRETPVRQRLAEALQQQASRDDLSPADRRRMNELRYALCEELGQWAQARSLADSLGQLTRWSEVVGSFSYADTTDIDFVFPPESNLARNRYPAFWGEVAWQPAPPTAWGWLPPAGRIHPVDGWCYALAALTTDYAGPATLELQTENAVKAWWNGQPVLRACRAELDYRQQLQTPVEVHPGENRLLVKLQAEPHPRLRARLYQADGAPFAFTVHDTTATTRARFSVQPGSPANTTPTTTVPDAVYTRLESWLDLIYQSAAAAARNDWLQERALLSAAAVAAPESVIPQLLLADSYLRQSRVQRVSHDRLTRQADAQLARITTQAPQTRRATALQLQQLLDRNQPRVALDRLEQALGAPLLQTTEVPFLLALQGARCARRLQRWPLARAAYAQAIARHPGSLAAHHEYAAFLIEQHADATAARLWQDFFSRRSAPPDVIAQAIQTLARNDRLDQADDLLQNQLKQHPAAPVLLDASCDLAALRGAPEQALATAQRAVTLFPLAAEAWDRYAREAQRAGSLQQARTAVRNGLQLAPEDPQRQLMQAELDSTTAEPFYAPYDQDPADVDRTRLPRWGAGRATRVYLVDIMVQRFFSNGAATRYTHQTLELLNRDGVEQTGELTLPGGAEVLYVRITLPDGTTYIADQLQQSAGKLVVSLYGLQIGAVIDYAYLQHLPCQPHAGAPYPRVSFIFGAINEPMVLSRLAVLAPPDLPLTWRAHPATFTPQQADSDTSQSLLWERHNIDGAPPHNYRPAADEALHSVNLTTLTGMHRQTAIFDELLQGRHEPSPRFAEVTAAHQQDAHAVYAFLQEEIKQQSAGHTDLDALANQSGDSLARQALLVRLLQQAGLTSAPAFARQTDEHSPLAPLPRLHPGHLPLVLTGPAADDSDLPCPLFSQDRSVCHWLDPTNRYAGFAELPQGWGRERAAVVTPAGQWLEPLVPSTWPGSWMRHHFNAILDAEGHATVNGRIVFAGRLPVYLREQLTNPQLRKRFKSQQLVATGMRGILADSSALQGLDQRSGNVRLDYRGSWPGAMRQQNDVLLLQPVTVPLQLSSYVSEVTRELALDLRQQARLAPYMATFQLPADSPRQWAALPADRVFASRQLDYMLTFRRDGNTVTVCRSVVLKPGLVQPPDYAEFRSLCRQIDEAERVSLTTERRQQELP